jgi:hypothetical protein
MARRKVLTEKDIAEAKKLKDEHKLSNRTIAQYFEVGKTTIWENVYATRKRIRIQSRRGKFQRCTTCGLLFSGKVENINNSLGGLCLGCCIKHFKQQNHNSKEIADFFHVDLEVVNKYWYDYK